MTLQVADIYTTYRGLQYNCVKELNPILGESPTVPQMFVFKTALLVPAIESDRKRGKLTPQLFNELNFVMSVVIANNLDVLSEAKESCRKL